MSIDYNKLTEITVHNQEEMDDIPLDFKGRIYIECEAVVKITHRYEWDIILRGSSRAVLRESSRAELWGSSQAELRGSSRAVLWESSRAELRGSSQAVLWGSSQAVLWESSQAVLWGNSQALNCSVKGKIKLNGNAREVFLPKTIHEFMDYYGIKHTKKTATFYKAVHKNKDGVLFSDFNNRFTYEVGRTKSERLINTDVNIECSSGIHIAHLDWALRFGEDWNDLAIIEVQTKIEDIILPKNSDGKVRTSKIKVIREVPLEECGAYGIILSRRLMKNVEK